MAPTTTAGKKQRLSRSARAGIIFPVARMHRLLKALPTAPSRVTKAASTYLASVLEYLVGMFIRQERNVAYA
jgi:histone H2A